MSRYDRGGPPLDISKMISLKIGNLSFKTEDEDLKRVFSRYGEVGDVYIPREHSTKKSRGFAFVRFFSQREADKAIDDMDQRKLDGRIIKVSLAKYGPPPTLVSNLRNRGKSGERYRDSSNGRRRSYSREKRSDRYDRRSRSPHRRSFRSPPHRRSRSRSPARDYDYGRRDDYRARNGSYDEDRRYRREEFSRRDHIPDDRRS